VPLPLPRHLASSGVDVYSAVGGGVAALYGPLHGGANEAVLNMLERLQTVDAIPAFLEGVKNRKEKLFGFGHRCALLSAAAAIPCPLSVLRYQHPNPESYLRDGMSLRCCLRWTKDVCDSAALPGIAQLLKMTCDCGRRRCTAGWPRMPGFLCLDGSGV